MKNIGRPIETKTASPVTKMTGDRTTRPVAAPMTSIVRLTTRRKEYDACAGFTPEAYQRGLVGNPMCRRDPTMASSSEASNRRASILDGTWSLER